MLDVAHAPQIPDVELHDFAPEQLGFEEALVRGLSANPKAIPCQFLYDAQGSALFDRICRLPEYYPTRTEISILTAHAKEIAALTGPGAKLVELGSGSSVKVRILLDAMNTPAAYSAVDVSHEHMVAAVEALAADYPALSMKAICADYAAPFDLPDAAGSGRAVGFFPGSTIGNQEPAEAEAFLRLWAGKLGPGAAMIVGVDLRKDASILEPAYDDAEGVTAAFSKNLLARANRELHTHFDLGQFRHEARYEPEIEPGIGRIAIHLRSLTGQSVSVGDRLFSFAAGERIHVENSYKYEVAGFQALATRAGFIPRQVWTDEAALFSVHYLETAAS